MQSNADVVRLAYAPGNTFRGERSWFSRLYRSQAAADASKARPAHLNWFVQEQAYQRRVGPINGSFRLWFRHGVPWDARFDHPFRTNV